MDNLSKSILLQVAYKGIIDSERELTEDSVIADYNLLIGLHDKLGIDDRGGATNKGRKPSGKRPVAERSSGGTFQTPESVTTFIDGNGELVEDFREAKAKGEVKQPKPDGTGGFPDFKYVNLKDERGQRKSVYLYDLEGNPNPEAAQLIAAADNSTEVFA